MKAKNLCTYAGLCAGFATVAVAGGDKPTPQLLENAIQVSPQRIAKVRMENGEIIRTSDWMDYNGGVTRGPTDDRVFDCFGDSDGDGVMDDAGGCGLGSSRWYFGTAYCNGFFTNDMNLHPDTVLEVGLGRVDLAWFWSCLAPPGGGVVEDCEILVFTQESTPVGCEPDSFDYSGWILDYGSLSCNSGFYYYSNVDLGGGTWIAPTGGSGSYYMIYTTSDGGALATCSQPMLWGTGDAVGGDPANPGTQETEQFDDDAPLNGTHTLTTECYTYSYGECPDPWGGMAQFWGELGEGNECDYADCNNDDTVDTRDFTCFFNLWVPKNGAADCDGNGTVDTRDFTCFLNQWVGCRG
jgi:hypothetical protein